MGLFTDLFKKKCHFSPQFYILTKNLFLTKNLIFNQNFQLYISQFRFLCPKDPDRNSQAQWAQCECDAKLANKLARVRAQKQEFMLNNEIVFEEQCREKNGKVDQIDLRLSRPQCCGEYPTR